jgi:hypothetical protein
VSFSASEYNVVQNFNREGMKVGDKEAELIKEHKKGSKEFADVLC